MTTLCPTCNNTLDRKHSDALGEDILRCRVCRRYSLDDLGHWLTAVDVEQMIRLAAQRDEDKARHKRFMESDISDPIWEQLYL